MKTKLFALAATLAALATPVHAAIFDFGGEIFSTNGSTSTLTLENTVPPGNQPQNNPCIICGTTQPGQNFDFGYNNYQQGGNINTFMTSSTAQTGNVQLANNTLGTGYTAAFLLAFLATQNSIEFNIGIDVNSGNTIEVLERFVVVDIVNRVILADFNPVVGVPLPTNNQGNGFPDYLLTGFDINRDDIQLDTQLVFLARFSNASDGAESFFIVPEVQAVPGPLVGAGIPGMIAGCMMLLGLGRYRRKREV